jgi:hypothetical protein
MEARTLCISIILVTACATSMAAGGDSSPSASPVVRDPIIQAAQDGIAKGDWLGTQALLKKAIASTPGNADYHNLYAFSTRKGPNPDMQLVFAEYETALRIDPRHKGALEYLGEAYLQTNNLAKAKEQLAKLDQICFFGCEEYTDLKKAVQQYEAAHPK